MKIRTWIKCYSLIWFLMLSFEASGTIPIFHVDAKEQNGMSIGMTLGKAFKKQFPEIEKIYDTYLASFITQKNSMNGCKKELMLSNPILIPPIRMK
ncbi:hypothetical protein [Candidatus Parabeggiatoa sp. HSG14]|uniref:hypothetical protein n=1 Tax=Candidatus Parabeggiatoa sp. HSG14 TaxID=3055593 RepID=UPI0025A77165|nr:hypothetical protein [Thiotrichales bacterium HSG14]